MAPPGGGSKHSARPRRYVANNLVICCDGTNNSLQRPLTNVAHLSHLASGQGSGQHVYYDAGVGAEAAPNVSNRISRTLSRWSGLAFGSGLVANVEQAYLELVDHYLPGDQVFLFGFSRGAYTVRVIAGLLQHFGLLFPRHRELVADVITAYKHMFDGNDPTSGTQSPEQQRRFDEARDIRTSRSVDCPIHFMGLFDTVSSLGWAWDPKTFPNTAKMPNVRTVRHALALDERRAKFRTNRVSPSEGQSLREVWFAGVHSDVGGGYEPAKGRLSRVPLRWMLREARTAGLLVNPTIERELDLDATVAADEQAPQNESLSALWRSLEFLPLPHRVKTATGWVEQKKIYRGEGWRSIRAGDLVSESVQRRMLPVKNTHWATARASIRWEP